MSRPRYTPNRRRLLRDAGALGFGAAATGSTLLTMGAAGRALANPANGEYRALVCILLAGGIDSFNVLVPNDDSGYADYAGVRTDLALPRDTLLPLAGNHQGGRAFAVHPALGGVQGLFDSGDLAFVANVGSLVEPTDLAAIEAGSARLPLGLYSHADQIAQWQTALPDARVNTGVGGRMADLLKVQNPDSPVSMNISTSGTNLFQTGQSVSEYAIDAAAGGAVAVAGHDADDPDGRGATAAIDAILTAPRDNLFRRSYGNRLGGAIAAGGAFNDALATVPPLTTTFGAGPLAQQLALIARCIGAREALGASRQTFFITVGGWDHHDDVLDNQAAMLPGIDTGLAAFRDAMVELGVHDCVTTFTISDFARTLTSNGKGSDHGWGGHQLVMGGAVAGGAIHGQFPELPAGNSLDTGRGRFIPTTSVDAFHADLALWFGVPASELDLVLPNIGRFWTPMGTSGPVGMFS